MTPKPKRRAREVRYGCQRCGLSRRHAAHGRLGFSGYITSGWCGPYRPRKKAKSGPLKIRAISDKQAREIAERARAMRMRMQEEIDRGYTPRKKGRVRR